VGVFSPWSLRQLVPVPLDLLAGRVLDLDGGPALHAGARLAVRPKLVPAKPSREARIRCLQRLTHHYEWRITQREALTTLLTTKPMDSVGLIRTSPDNAPA
jgi:hypothetical protein